MSRWFHPVLRYPKTCLAVLLAGAAYFGNASLRMESDPSVLSFLRESDPDYRFYNLYKAKFRQEEILVVGFEDRDIFTPANLALIRRLTEKIEDVDNVFDVRSLSNAEYMKSTEDSFEAQALVGAEIPRQEAVLSAARKTALENPIFRQDLISPDARHTAILVTFRAKERGYLYEREMEEIDRIVQEEAAATGKTFHLAGERYLDRRFQQYILQDVEFFMPVTFLVLALILFLTFRNLRDTVIGLVTISFCLALTGGLIPLTGWKMDSVNAGLPSLILCIAVLNVVHIIHRFRIAQETIPDRTRALGATMGELLAPMAMCNFTTAVGFGTNILSDVRPIKGFSVVASLGIAGSFLICLVAVPALLQVWRGRGEGSAPRKSLIPASWMIGLTHTILRWRRLVVLGCAAFFLLALLGIPFIQAQSDRTQYLRRGSEVFAAVQFVDRNLAGTNQLDILIEGGQEGTFKEPAVLAKVERLSEFLRAQPEISKVISINDYLKEMNKSFNQGGPEYYVLPPTRESIAQFLLIYSMSGRKNELEKYVDAPYSRTRVSVRTPEHNTAPLEALTGRIQAYLSDHFPAPLEARVASLVPPINSVVHYLVNGMLWSLAASVLMVGAIVCLGFRSLYPGLVCMIPNLTPIVACLGLMGWCGIWLDVATAMTFSIALGLTVDDTVHFMSVYRMELERTRDEGQALRLTLEAVGPAMVEAGIIIVCGFLILVFASLRMNAIFGLLCAFIMFMALLTDLLITPLCMIVLKPFRFAQPAPGRPAAAAPPVTPLLDT